MLAPAIKLIHSLESDDETRSCFEEGKAYYLAMERRSIIDTILGLLFIWASVLWAYERPAASGRGRRSRGCGWFLNRVNPVFGIQFPFQGLLAAGIAAPINQDIRPVSASVACLLEGIYGLSITRKRTVFMHNAAVGLYRAAAVKRRWYCAGLPVRWQESI